MAKSKKSRVAQRPAQIFNSFSSNINSLQVFVHQIGGYAQKYDLKNKKDLDTLKKGFNSLFKDENMELVPDQKKKNSQRYRIKFKNLETAIKFTDLVDTIKKRPKEQIEILRQGALVLAVSYFEVLLSQLIQAHFLKYPQSLSQEKELTLAEIKELGSVRDIELYLIEHEADTVLRKNTKDQFDYFKTRFKIVFDPIEHILDDLTEVSSRRNVIVHNNGKASRLYLKSISRRYANKNGIKEGKLISPSASYLTEAIEKLYAVGIYLIQVCWRKWFNDQKEDANNNIANEVFEALQKENYELVVALYKLSTSFDDLDDATSRVMLINCAIALRMLGKTQDILPLLDLMDWTSCSSSFQVGVCILRDEVDLAIKHLEKAMKADEITKEDLVSWPLFKLVKKNRTFKKWIKTEGLEV